MRYGRWGSFLKEDDCVDPPSEPQDDDHQASQLDDNTPDIFRLNIQMHSLIVREFSGMSGGWQGKW